AFVVLLVAAARQANAILDEVPEEWSVSMRGASRRIPKALGLSALLAGVLFVLFWIMMISASLVPISALLMLPLWLIGTVVVCVRFSLTNITAALAPNNVGCLRTSLALTRPYFWPLVGRMALLSMFGLSLVLMLQIVATPFVAIGGGAGTAPIDLGAGEIPLVDVLGDNPAVFAIQQLFNGLAYGAVMVIWTVGFVLIYRDLSGPVEPGNSEPAEASLS
ncbi:MAG: hypothetical protein GY773_25830, partial [Actinomycetia bacterium]|nr:hypothetical protein [Actinomycetes bacterium]